MKHNYYGIVSGPGMDTIYENQYASQTQGVKSLSKKAKEAAQSIADDYVYLNLTLFYGEKIVASGKVRSGVRPRWKFHSPADLVDIGSMPLSGVRVC
jgi:hypothetical protein